MPLAVPRLRLGLKRIAKKYDPRSVAPIKQTHNIHRTLQREVPDSTGNSVFQHVFGGCLIATQMLGAALALEKEPESRKVVMLVLYVMAFLKLSEVRASRAADVVIISSSFYLVQCSSLRPHFAKHASRDIFLTSLSFNSVFPPVGIS